MTKVKIIIGANYDDEGKGLLTNVFSREAREESKRCLNILYNGGPQRGHTVDYKIGVKHVFHHFGSGTLANADTFFDKDFMVNPMEFVREYNELIELGYDPYVMVYDKQHAAPFYKSLQRWVNMRAIFHRVKTFEEYDRGKAKE